MNDNIVYNVTVNSAAFDFLKGTFNYVYKTVVQTVYIDAWYGHE